MPSGSARRSPGNARRGRLTGSLRGSGSVEGLALDLMIVVCCGMGLVSVGALLWLAWDESRDSRARRSRKRTGPE